MTSEEDKVLQSCDTPVNPYFKYCLSSGLRNSAAFVVEMLNHNGIEAKLVEVVDNNSIDKEVFNYKPTHVIIEAFWVVPEKFTELSRLHPKVKWIIRNHSELPFLASEGCVMDWSIRYLKHHNVSLAPNSLKSFEDTKKIIAAAYSPLVSECKVMYLPNYYQNKSHLRDFRKIGNVVDVGCFGAVRPLKNHLVQAVAAINYCRHEHKKLRFHINVARIEDAGNSVLKSLRGLFENLDPNRYELIEHGWLTHHDFLKLVRKMDIGLQASFSETFNIVTADFVSQGVPMIVSSEIDWMPKDFYCNHTDSEHIEESMRRVLTGWRFWFKAKYALRALTKYNKKSEKIWVEKFA